MSEITLENQLFEIIKDKEMPEHVKLAKVDMLISLGVDVNVLYGAKSALWVAKENGLKDIYKILEKNGAKDFVDKNMVWDLGKELFRECEEQDIEKVKELINKGADIEVKTSLGMTPLLLASCKGHKDVVKLLLEKGSDVEAKNDFFNTPLMEASQYGHKEVVEVLLQKDVDINAKNARDGQTALMKAVKKGYREVVELLLEKSADVNEKDDSGRTALMFAASEGNKELVELLLEKGADVNIKEYNSGLTALDWAENEEIKDMIINVVKEKNIKESGKFIGTMKSWFGR